MNGAIGKEYDVVVVGSGLGGLVSAVTLAKEGMRVCVLEKNNQFGGNLQTFSRDKKLFDTGVHYIGGLAEGQNLHRYFSYLGIMDDLLLERMPTVFDRVCFADNGQCYPIAQGYDAFVAHLVAHFPKERAALEQYVVDIQDTCRAFPLYDVQDGTGRAATVINLELKDYFKALTDNERLRAVLIGQNFLYAGGADGTPFYVHALAVNSYIQSAYRCLPGGSQISKLLVRELRRWGGEAYRREEVVGLEITDGKLHSLSTQGGKRIFAKRVILNIDPKRGLQLIGKEHFRKSFYDRIQALPVTTSAFSLHGVLTPKIIRYQAHNIYLYQQPESVWRAADYQGPEDWGNMLMLSMTEDPRHPGYADSFTVLTYMHFDEVEPWAGTSNTVLQPGSRGADYAQFKQEKTEQLLKKMNGFFPDLQEALRQSYVSTPLSYRDYIGVHRGNLYGHRKDVSDPLKTFIAPKTKIANLYLTGHGIYMHGILGVTVGAVATCAEILGRSYLLGKINH